MRPRRSPGRSTETRSTAFLANAQDGFQPGMQQYIDPTNIYGRALKPLRKLPPLSAAPPVLTR
jgi:hypothetical protein